MPKNVDDHNKRFQSTFHFMVSVGRLNENNKYKTNILTICLSSQRAIWPPYTLIWQAIRRYHWQEHPTGCTCRWQPTGCTRGISPSWYFGYVDFVQIFREPISSISVFLLLNLYQILSEQLLLDIWKRHRVQI